MIIRKKALLIIGSLLTFALTFSQTNHFERINFIMGEWTGTGSGFGNNKSKIESCFRLIMDGKYVEVNNESWFGPGENNPQGGHHADKGFICYDEARKAIVYRQFNSEGIISQYVLNDALSADSIVVFETEVIENSAPGGKARWIIKKISENNIETTFDVSYPDKEFAFYGTNKLNKSAPSMTDQEPKVTGVGGIFFFSENPEEIKDWYCKNLGLEMNEWGSSFEFRNANRPDEINYLQWSPFRKGNEYFAPSNKEFMINYRVQNIEGLVKKLRENGVTIVDDIESFEYGKFVHVMDPEGNKIELWEPVDSVFTKMGGKTTK